MRKLAALVGLAILGGCATTAEDYGGSPAAAQALADCRVQSDSLLANPAAAANPFFVAASQQQYVVDCMRAKGFQTR